MIVITVHVSCTFLLRLYTFDVTLFPVIDKCLFPYYGGCFHTRECQSTAREATCGLCRPGFARDSRNYETGECVGIIICGDIIKFQFVDLQNNVLLLSYIIIIPA